MTAALAPEGIDPETGEIVEKSTMVDSKPVVLFTVEEAETHTAKIVSFGGALVNLIHEAHDRGAWKVLGYPSFVDYVNDRLGMGKARAYQLLQYAVASEQLALAAELDAVEVQSAVSERATRTMDLTEAVALVKQAIRDMPKDAPVATRKDLIAAVVAEMNAAAKAPEPAAKNSPAGSDDPSADEAVGVEPPIGRSRPAPAAPPSSEGNAPTSDGSTDAASAPASVDVPAAKDDGPASDDRAASTEGPDQDAAAPPLEPGRVSGAGSSPTTSTAGDVAPESHPLAAPVPTLSAHHLRLLADGTLDLTCDHAEPWPSEDEAGKWESDDCWLMSHWEAIGSDLMGDDERWTQVRVLPIPVTYEGNGWDGDLCLVPVLLDGAA